MDNKELTKKEETAILAEVPEGSWGGEEASNSDILIPKLLLMQGISQLVMDGKATVGDMVNSIDDNILAHKTETIGFVPIYTFNSWVIFQNMSGKWEYKGVEPRNAANDGLPWEDIVNGAPIRRDKSINVYAIMERDLDNPGALPYLISFRRTSYRAGRKFVSLIKQLEFMRKPIAAAHIKLTNSMKENEKGKFYVFDVSMGDPTSEQHLAKAYQWYQTLKIGMHKVDDSDLKSEASKEVPVSPGEEF